MSLSLYNNKRRFDETSEPEGKEKKGTAALSFVIQKHDATNLHYDFRLEMNGVLKSWAVPKGPSLNPAEKRLAMQVEDHPFDYRDFEGIIPAGNYGGGVVLLWDEGTYELYDAGTMSTADQEKALSKALEAGNLKIVLHGKKIKGMYHLFQLKKGEDGKSWLLVKDNDKYASEEEIVTRNKSVRSRKTLAKIAAEAGVELNHPGDPTAGPVAKQKGKLEDAPRKTKVKKSPAKDANKAAPVKKAGSKTAAAATSAESAVDRKGATRKRRLLKTSGTQIDLGQGTEQVVSVDGHELKVTSLDKFYSKKDRFQKIDSLNYYFKIAPFILPYLLERPQSLNRHPNGIDESNFFQKDMKGKQAEWMKTHTDFSESTDQEVQYLVCSNEATLIYMANLGCIEINPWHSRSKTWQKPDWCVIDLDPDKGNTFEQVIQVARVVKNVLDSIGAPSFVKTSGSSGIHIYVPLGGLYSYDQSKTLAELVVNLVKNELPDLTSIERNPLKRKKMIYLDFLQNRETQTAAAPYSLRPRPGMPVSTPLHWDEVKKGLSPTTYHARNIHARLKTEGDLFSGVLGKGIDLQKVLQTLESMATS